MRKVAFSVALIGLIFLLCYMHFSPPISPSSKNLSAFEENQKISFSGKVISESTYKELKVLKLDNNITAYCACLNTPSLKGKKVSGVAIIDKFQGIKLRVLKIRWY